MVWIALGAIVIFAVTAVAMYNGLVRLKVQSQSAWGDIDVQLKRRHDLVPNLVETVKGYAGHERATLDAVIEARSRALTAERPGARAAAEGVLSGALKDVFALAEAYPQLRAVETFTSLQAALGETEEALQSARRYYNACVRDLNTKIEQFPSSIVAGLFRFERREFFEVRNPGEAEVPKVTFTSIGG